MFFHKSTWILKSLHLSFRWFLAVNPFFVSFIIVTIVNRYKGRVLFIFFRHRKNRMKQFEHPLRAMAWIIASDIDQYIVAIFWFVVRFQALLKDLDCTHSLVVVLICH